MDKLEKKLTDNTKINKTYGLIVRVDMKDIPIKDQKRDGSFITYTSKMLYLIPDITTQATFFFDAWLPALAYKDNGDIFHHEVLVQFGHPLFRTARCGVCRKNKNYPDSHHLVLMDSESCENILSGMIGQKLTINVLPDSADHGG